jgi:RNA polymerase sigma-70 factor (ECF subfamily)
MTSNGQEHTAVLDHWIDLLNRGSPEARNGIIDHACERLRGLARRMLREYSGVRRWSETDDVLQNAMIRLHRSLAEVRPESARQFYGLAATQIRRELIDLARHHNGPEGEGANHHTDGGHAAETEADRRGEPETLDAWTEFHERAEQLPEEEREVFSLLWYEGLTQPDAAAVLGISLATLKRRWQSARVLLHRAMRDGHQD